MRPREHYLAQPPIKIFAATNEAEWRAPLAAWLKPRLFETRFLNIL
jgi:hypothetical protein